MITSACTVDVVVEGRDVLLLLFLSIFVARIASGELAQFDVNLLETPKKPQKTIQFSAALHII